MAKKETLILCILDGLGIGEETEYNAFYKADTPFFDNIINNYPNSQISTSGLNVGLPEGQMGNSEVGHMSISSGRIILQDLPRINLSIKDGSIKKNINLTNFLSDIGVNRVCHVIGLFSNGGIHSHIDHIIYFAKYIAYHKIKIYLHIITDGRDTSPFNIINNIDIIKDLISNKNILIATISGRYYAMDRDRRWDRTEKAYNAIVLGKGKKFNNIYEIIEFNKKNNIYDEFIEPSIIGEYPGFRDHDSIFMANFRVDRAIQILSSILSNDFSEFNRERSYEIYNALGMVEYSDDLSKLMLPIFDHIKLKNILPEIISNSGLKQLRVAETEKYAHVTYFFNGGKDILFEGEKRILIESKKISTYDEFPEMSSFEITDSVIEAINSDAYDLIIVNYANCDMVGHTGNLEKSIIAVETIDTCLAKIKIIAQQTKSIMLITSDHGNVEQIFDKNLNSPHTSHTSNPVPLIIIGYSDYHKKIKLKNGKLSDIAPTILDIINIKKPEEMTGTSLILKH